jgi:hypothetical protein
MELANELRTAWAESDFGDGLKQPVADAWEGSDPTGAIGHEEAFATRSRFRGSSPPGTGTQGEAGLDRQLARVLLNCLRRHVHAVIRHPAAVF